MATDFVKRLKLIKSENKLLVHGYVHEISVKSDVNIPSSIIDICIVFTFIIFQWDLETKCDRLQADNDTLKVTYKDGRSEEANIYSSTILSEKLIYTFKIQVFNHEYGIFGITHATSKANELTKALEAYVDYEYGYGWGGHYAQTIHNDCSKKYAVKPHDKDIIEMRFDKINGTLSYKLNGTDYGIAFADIDIEIDYKFAAYMFDGDEGFQIIDFYMNIAND